MGIVRIGVTHKVCRRKSHEKEWLGRTCCKLGAAHIFVTELTVIEKLKEPYPFSKGNLVPVVGSNPTCRECVRSSEILSKRIAAKAGRLEFCGGVGVRQNCERCAPVGSTSHNSVL